MRPHRGTWPPTVSACHSPVDTHCQSVQQPCKEDGTGIFPEKNYDGAHWDFRRFREEGAIVDIWNGKPRQICV